MLVFRTLPPCICLVSLEFAGIHLYSWVERGSVRGTRITHEPLDPESNVLTTI